MKCESCENFEVSCELNIYNNGNYKICLNCLTKLVNVSLNKIEFRNLLKNGHEDYEYYLHEDFYDGDGNALQPND